MDKIKIKAEAIQRYVEQALGVVISQKTRRREVAYAKSLYFKLARENTPMTLTEIGLSTGNDHVTVIHSINKTFPTAFTYEDRIRDAYVNFGDFNIMPGDILLHLRNRLSDHENKVLESYGYLPEIILPKNDKE
jgi:hypothetical protein